MTRTMLKFAVALSAFLSSIALGIQARATETGSKKYDPPALYLTWQGDPDNDHDHQVAQHAGR